MSSIEIISLVVTILCLVSFCCAFTFLFRHYYSTETQRVLDGREDGSLLEDIYLNAKKRSEKPRRMISLGLRIVGDVVLVLVAAFFVCALVARFTSGTIFIGDQAVLVIATGSMSEKNEANDYLFENGLDDQFDAYDIIQIRKYDSPEQVRLYDVVAYKSLDGDIIVHRIIQTDGNGYITRGDANAVSDTGITYNNRLSYDDILGYYTGGRVPGLGSIVVFLQSNAGIITIISILYCLGMFGHFSSKYDQALEERKEYLLSKVDFDWKDGESAENATVTFDVRLTYRGRDYRLEPTEGKKDGKEEGTHTNASREEVEK